MTSNKADWRLTTATVYSADWVPRTRNDFGHFNVVYSYRVDNEYYTGEFNDYGSENEPVSEAR